MGLLSLLLAPQTGDVLCDIQLLNGGMRTPGVNAAVITSKMQHVTYVTVICHRSKKTNRTEVTESTISPCGSLKILWAMPSNGNRHTLLLLRHARCPDRQLWAALLQLQLLLHGMHLLLLLLKCLHALHLPCLLSRRCPRCCRRCCCV